MLTDLPPSISRNRVHTSIWYPMSPSDNVTVNISVPVSVRDVLVTCMHNGQNVQINEVNVVSFM